VDIKRRKNKMSAMKDYLLDLESLLTENSRMTSLYQHAIKMQNKACAELFELKKEHKKELEGLKLENVLLGQGYQGQYLFAKKLAVQNNILYDELFSLRNKINETLAVHGIGSIEGEMMMKDIFK
jgi:hypothetical protein